MAESPAPWLSGRSALGRGILFAVQLVAALALTVVLSAEPDAGPMPLPSAEAEVEALLAATARQNPSAEVVVVVEGPDAKVYRLEEATVQLDGAALAISAVSPSGPPRQGTPVSDGDHVVSARLVYRGQPTGPYPWEGGPRWSLPARLTLQASRGLRFTIRLVVETNALAPVPGQRLTLHTEVEPQMLVAVDDAPLPPPPIPRLPPPVLSPAPPPPEAPAVAAAPAALPKKKAKKKAARTAHASGAAAVPSTATAAGARAVSGSDTPNALEEATARLRSALAAPGDAGTATSH